MSCQHIPKRASCEHCDDWFSRAGNYDATISGTRTTIVQVKDKMIDDKRVLLPADTDYRVITIQEIQELQRKLYVAEQALVSIAWFEETPAKTKKRDVENLLNTCIYQYETAREALKELE